MEVTLKELLVADSSIAKLMEQTDLPAKFQWRLAPLIEILREYQELHNKMVDANANIDSEGKAVLKVECKDKVMADLEELQNEKKEIDFTLMDINELLAQKDENGEPVVKITAVDYINLKPFITGTPNF